MTIKTNGLREFGKFRLDSEKRVLWFEDKPVNLALKEIELLCVLTESVGEVITKDELLEKVWADSFVEESNLSRHIYVLRKTFKDLGEECELIQTVPRRGYRFAGKLSEIEAENDESIAVENHTSAQKVKVREGVNGIAVLPFVNLSADAKDEFFCDGLAEELLNTLAKIQNLKVAARTSSFSFKNKNVKISEIGRALGVNLVLEGSVGRVGNQLRITARLVSAADGFHLWSERFDREIKDIFDVQDEITLTIVNVLRVKLCLEEESVLFKRYTDDTEVYELYLKGRYHVNNYTGEDLQKAITYFKQAVEKEPEYAPAYAGIAQCLLSLWFFGTSAPDKIVPQWRAMLNRALEIDNALPETHSLLASFNFYYEWNLEEAEKEFGLAIKIKPSSADSYFRLGLLLASVGRFEEAVEAGKRAVDLDPLSLLVNLYVGIIYFFADLQDEAAERAQKMINLEPQFFGAYWLSGVIHKAKGEYETAAEQLKKAVQLGGNQTVLSILGGTYALMGKRDKALTILNQLLEMRERQYVSAYDIARIYSGIGAADEAFEWLEKAFDERSGELVFLEAETKIGAGFEWSKAFYEDARLSDLLSKHFPRPVIVTKTEEPGYFVSNTAPSKTYRVFAFSHFRAAAIAAILILLFAAGFAFWKYDGRIVQKPQIKSIAVLPLKSFAADTGDESLRMRITDALITGLASGAANFSVRSTSAVLPFVNTEKNIPEIGKNLEVDAIIDGRVQHEGERVRVTLQFVLVSTGEQVWSQQFDGQEGEILNLQDEISSQLSQKLDPGDRQNNAKRPTLNTEAFENYLKGRFFWNKRTQEDLQKSIGFFEKAIALDSEFALAHAGLADVYCVLPEYSDFSEKDSYSLAQKYALRALELNDNLAEARTALAFVEFWNNKNFAEAEKNFRRAIADNPNYPTAHHWFANVLLANKNFTEAEKQMSEAQKLDPLSLVINTELGDLFYYSRQNDSAAAQFRRTLEIDPKFYRAAVSLGRVLTVQGKYEDALALYQSLPAEVAQIDSVIAEIALTNALANNRSVAETHLKNLLSHSTVKKTAFNSAIIYLGLGKKEKAVEYLKKAAQERESDLAFLDVDPIFDSLRENDEFNRLTSRYQ